MSRYYCGNNRNSANGRILGTRYKCLKIGIGKGFNMAVDPEYLNDYDPIDIRKIYCGKKNRLPNGYDYMGNAPLCLQKGIGIGKKQKAEGGSSEGGSSDDGGDFIYKNNNLRYFLILFFCILFFTLIYTIKPKFIIKTKNKKKEIIWYKFILFYFIIVIPISFLIFKIF